MTPDIEPKMLTLAQAAERLGIGGKHPVRALRDSLVARGVLESRKIGRWVFVPVVAVDSWLSVEQAAHMLALDQVATDPAWVVRKMLKQGELSGVQCGHRWYVRRESVEKLVKGVA